MICVGIDAGSRAIKAVLWDADNMKVASQAVTDQGVQQDQLASALLGDLLDQHGIDKDDVGPVVATGYGRNAVHFADTTITEITCHAVGVRHVAPDAMTLIDIGGQDSKLVRLDRTGKVRDFAMNDRCAAGTGRFLEVVAARLDLPLTSLGDRAARSNQPAAISSMCVVFAETEIIGLLASGRDVEDIIAGVQNAIAARVVAMAGRAVESPVLFTGGVAMVPGMDQALRTALRQEVTICPDPQMTGALGAALLAARQLDQADP